MDVPERRRIIVCLANLLMQAAGGATEGDGDEER
jgi:hypothetical protein